MLPLTLCPLRLRRTTPCAGQLALSRAFGDFSFKANGTKADDEQKVIAAPVVDDMARAYVSHKGPCH